MVFAARAKRFPRFSPAPPPPAGLCPTIALFFCARRADLGEVSKPERAPVGADQCNRSRFRFKPQVLNGAGFKSN